MSQNNDNPTLYRQTLARVASVYPHGKIQTPSWASLTQTSLNVTTPNVIGQVTTEKGAHVQFGDDVRALRGNNRFIADGPECLIAIGSGSTFENSLIRIIGRGSVVIIGENCRIRGLAMVVSRENSVVVIGSNTTIEGGKIISESGNIIAIGDDCMMSVSVELRTSDGHTIFDAATRKPINDSANVHIGRHVWLGSDVRVGKGTSIGSGTVIGQFAVATGRLDPNCVYAGVPARKLKENIVWSRTHRYADIPKEFLP